MKIIAIDKIIKIKLLRSIYVTFFSSKNIVKNVAKWVFNVKGAVEMYIIKNVTTLEFGEQEN